MRMCAGLLSLLCLVACGEEVKKTDLVVTPPPTYHGPPFLRGSIGSVVELRNNRDTLVSGYGIVVGLDSTGSGDCPAFLRGWVMNELRKGGFGQTRLELANRTPEAELASGRLAIVKIEGTIPAGAPRGTRIDLRVSALPETATTSLENGTLYSTELRADGANPERVNEFRATQAKGGGPLFINPFIEATRPADDIRDQRRIGLVLAGGITLVDAQLKLATTRPSLTLVQGIAARINERLPRLSTKDLSVAVPQSESVINLNVPHKYHDDPQRFLDLISHLFLDPRPQFTIQKAEELAAVLADPANHKHADDIALTWEAMGKTALPVIRRHYDHKDPIARMAGLQAGARLGDTKTFEHLRRVASGNDGRLSEQATALLGELLGDKPDSPPLTALLRHLLDHDDPQVRMAAFDALAAVGDSSIDTRTFPDKMEISFVRCSKPLIYAARSGRPRIIIFDDQLGFRQPMLFTLWDNRFMLKSDRGGAEPTISLFYRRPEERRPAVRSIPATVPYLAGVLAFKETNNSHTPGLDFTYNRIIAVFYALTQGKYIDAPLVFQQDDPLQKAARRRLGDVPLERPETSSTTQPVNAVQPVVSSDKSRDNPGSSR